jgi:hypothetical protein
VVGSPTRDALPTLFRLHSFESFGCCTVALGALRDFSHQNCCAHDSRQMDKGNDIMWIRAGA